MDKGVITNVVFFVLLLLCNTYTHWFLVHIYIYIYIYICNSSKILNQSAQWVERFI